jgi:SAM-dependent methyltransferase
MNTKIGSWEFNEEVAKTFVNHARQHIPNYDLVIDKSINLCRHLFTLDAKIVDVGAATGETIRRLHQAGFNNLTGIEASCAMLAHCDHNIAKYLHTDKFPQELFDAVLCNWTLHFIEDKERYLIDIHRNLNTNGLLILSEKTSIDPLAINFYHEWKYGQGVSWEEISNKEDAIKDIMYINNPQWYIDTLTWIGFKNIQIIDASWCFTTFICQK